jgi:hypothetical protein
VRPTGAVERPKPSPAALLPFGGAAQTVGGARDEAQTAKLKLKTRGVPAEGVDAEIVRPDPEVDPPAVRAMPVSSRAHSVRDPVQSGKRVGDFSAASPLPC